VQGYVRRVATAFGHRASQTRPALPRLPPHRQPALGRHPEERSARAPKQPYREGATKDPSSIPTPSAKVPRTRRANRLFWECGGSPPLFRAPLNHPNRRASPFHPHPGSRLRKRIRPHRRTLRRPDPPLAIAYRKRVRLCLDCRRIANPPLAVIQRTAAPARRSSRIAKARRRTSLRSAPRQPIAPKQCVLPTPQPPRSRHRSRELCRERRVRGGSSPCRLRCGTLARRQNW
jgi:hypothetical protein